MGRAATPCLLAEIIIIDTSDSEPDPAQSLSEGSRTGPRRVREADTAVGDPIQESRAYVKRTDRTCVPASAGTQIPRGYAEMTNQASSKQLIDVVSAVRHTQLAAFLDLGVGMDRGAPGPWRRTRC